MANIGILHPGSMGSSVAATLKNGGQDVYWAAAGRSLQTRQRAEKLGLQDAGSLRELCERCEMIVSVCPPHAAEEVAKQVASHAFRGIYLEANAISPQRSSRIGEIMQASGARAVDGGIIGPPAWEPGTTRLYLSGEGAGKAAAYFSAGPLETCVLEGSIGKASALKMCYAAYTKGTTALLCAVVAAAQGLGVREDLEKEWSTDEPGFAETTNLRVRRVTARAWRFAGEMDEIAATFQQAGVPGGFHVAASDIYRRMKDFKDAPSLPELEIVLEALRKSESKDVN